MGLSESNQGFSEVWIWVWIWFGTALAVVCPLGFSSSSPLDCGGLARWLCPRLPWPPWPRGCLGACLGVGCRLVPAGCLAGCLPGWLPGCLAGAAWLLVAGAGSVVPAGQVSLHDRNNRPRGELVLTRLGGGACCGSCLGSPGLLRCPMPGHPPLPADKAARHFKTTRPGSAGSRSENVWPRFPATSPPK